MKITDETFLIADTHFGDFNSVSSHYDEYLVNNWNSVISDADTVFILGDFVSDDGDKIVKSKLKRYSSLLKGRKFLLRGNHDMYSVNMYRDYNITIVNSDYKIVNAVSAKINDVKILLSHYPVENIYKLMHPADNFLCNYEDPFKYHINTLNEIFINDKFDLNIHGHIHDKIKLFNKMINVSPSNINYTPIKLYDILKMNKNLTKVCQQE